ncbi:glycosyltransferase family protein [Desulfovibrio sp. SGI.169]|uniref:glycosyltransferase n=1 Tax=Desulfovibrio sp. SGI.169 TaxID=3420561 RepID=UPI003CFE2A6D
MNILLVDCDFGEMPGHTVRRVKLKGEGGLVPVRRLLRASGGSKENFRPDLLVQREHLARRIFLSGLEELDCPKIFWALDTHLNLFWQRWYGRLFDLILTPHPHLFNSLPAAWRLENSARPFAMPGCRRAWRSHAQRRQTAAFVGVLDQNRPRRFNFAQFLRQRHHVDARPLAFHAMLDLYDDTRLLPNESICQEFNFRIMEGASCGCCVLTEDIGEDLRVHFEPGQEVLTYRHALELDELLSFFSTRPALTEKIGQAARRRVQTAHLPEHRAAELGLILRSLSARSRSSGESERIFALACVQWARGNPAYRKHLPSLMTLLERQGAHPDVTAMRLRLALESARMGEARNLLSELLASEGRGPGFSSNAEESLDSHTACAVAALRLGDWPAFQTCWRFRHGKEKDMPAPANFFQGCLAWADVLARSGRFCQPGFQFDPTLTCPESALEMLLMAEQWIQDEESRRLWGRKMAECCDRTPLLSLALSCNARRSLDSPEDWRASLGYALACLRNFRFEEGVAEVEAAYGLARNAGQEADFRLEIDRQGIHCARFATLAGAGAFSTFS